MLIFLAFISQMYCSVLKNPGGHVLLAGVGGSGRRSLCTLATALAGFKLATIELTKSYGQTEWKDDLKRVMTQAGRDGASAVFLLSDSQIVKESFIEDVNSILNSADVPGLFAADERAAIIADVQASAKKEGISLLGNAESWSYFVERVRSRLHVVLAFSPIGDSFRTRLRTFPSLVNCMTCNWFAPWPEEALRSVATRFLDGLELPGADPAALKAAVIDVCVDMQTRVSELSRRYLAELKRHYYVTPTSFLELLHTFTQLVKSKREDILGAKARYENGLTKLVGTEAQVAGMQAELIELQPKLKTASAETEAMIVSISGVSAEVAAKSDLVAKEEAVCTAQAATAQAMKSDCEAQLAEAIPALNAALKAVAGLSKGDITEVRSLKKVTCRYCNFGYSVAQLLR